MMTYDNDFSSRLDACRRMADVLERRKCDLQEAAAQDVAFPVRITGMEVDLAADYLRTMQQDIAAVENGRPYGTVAAIFPYDAAAIMLARLGGGALLTGNRLRFSFSSLTPRTAAILAEVCSGFSEIEPTVGMGNREFGRRCVEDDSVRVLFMSGASAVGEAYRHSHEAFDKLFFAGPGGMPAAVVFQDADPDLAGRFIGRRAFINGGQYCTTIKKALVHRSHYEAVRARALEAAGSLKVGDPLDPETEMGPIRAERTRRILQRAMENCPHAHRLHGGIDGDTVYPIVLEMEQGQIPDLELFGPFLLLKPFDDPDEAVREVIQTRYGFLLAFFGSPPEGARDLFDANFGMVHDNPDFFFTPLRLPFGGKKESGWILERNGQSWITRDGAFLYTRELVRM